MKSFRNRLSWYAQRCGQLPGPSVRVEPEVESALDEDLNPHPCEEDEEYSQARPNTEEMEKAISKFMDGMPDTYQYIPVCTSMYLYVLVCTCMY